MIELKPTQERAILVALKTKDLTKELVAEHLSELEELTRTVGAETVFKITQDRYSADKTLYVGKGKAEEITQLAELNEVTTIIFDDDLTPVQLRNLEKMINRKIIDRSGLILDIFASRAKTKEAKTQVELAQLQYMMPRLTRAWTHLSKQYGGIGTKGPGETQIETDRRIIKDRIALLKEKLIKVEEQRKTQSQGRKNFIRLSLVGYTNAGKSTLFNLLTNSEVLAEDKLFATLDSTTRTISLDKNTDVLISDTVGFIRKLPHHLVASFKSTLNEVRDSDIILHVVDVSNPFYNDHITVVEQTLNELKCSDKPIIKVFNKVDLIDNNELSFILNGFANSVIISAKRGININQLLEKILGISKEKHNSHILRISTSESKSIALIYSTAKVTDIKYEDDYAEITFIADEAIKDKLEKKLKTKCK